MPILNRFGSLASAYIQKGINYEELGDFEKASIYFKWTLQQVIEGNLSLDRGEWYSIFYNLGDLTRDRDPYLAIEYFQAAKEVRPTKDANFKLQELHKELEIPIL